jgi:hypothetical protein
LTLLSKAEDRSADDAEAIRKEARAAIEDAKRKNLRKLRRAVIAQLGECRTATKAS